MLRPVLCYALLAKLRSFLSLLQPFSQAKLGRHHSPSPSFLPDPGLASPSQVATMWQYRLSHFSWFPLLAQATTDAHLVVQRNKSEKWSSWKITLFMVFFFFFLSFLPRLFVSGSLFWRRWCHIAGGSVRMGMWTAGAACSRDLCCWDKDMPTSEVTFMQHHSYSLLGSCRTLLEQGMWWLQ